MLCPTHNVENGMNKTQRQYTPTAVDMKSVDVCKRKYRKGEVCEEAGSSPKFGEKDHYESCEDQ